jgi:hypothetical protein
MHTRALMAAVAMILAVAVLRAQPTGLLEHSGSSRRIELL